MKTYHIKSCKYCKSKIKEKLNSNNVKQEITNVVENNSPMKFLEHFDGNINIFGYNLKELIIIIMAGIILVFVLDLLVKIGRRTKK